MKHSGLLLSLLATLAAAPAIAQTADAPAAAPAEAPADAPAEVPAEAPTDAPAEATAETPAEQATGTQFDTGTPVDEQAPAEQGPQLYIKETFNDWSMQCLKVPAEGGEQEVCQMFQLLKDTDGNNVAEVTIAKLEGGKPGPAGGTFIVPLQTLLTQKLTVAVDGNQPRQYEFSFCTQIGCFSRVAFSAEDIARFKAGAKATVTLTPMVAPDRPVTLDMSLSGFTAAYEAASSIRP